MSMPHPLRKVKQEGLGSRCSGTADLGLIHKPFHGQIPLGYVWESQQLLAKV